MCAYQNKKDDTFPTIPFFHTSVLIIAPMFSQTFGQLMELVQLIAYCVCILLFRLSHVFPQFVWTSRELKNAVRSELHRES